MKALFPMTDADDGARNGGSGQGNGGTPTIPRARTSTGAAADKNAASSVATANAAAPGAPSPPWWRRGWDIPWLGGRSTAPWVVLTTVVVLLLALAGALYAKQKPDRLGFNPRTSEAVSDTAVRFTFDVYKAPEAEASCDIVAADQQGGVGSLRDVRIPPRADGEENTEVTVLVPTTRRAETALLQGCRIIRTG